MTNDKNLYFIPMIARALESDDPIKAMDEAFDEIRQLGTLPEYSEGFLQFVEFTKAALDASGGASENSIQEIRDAVYGLMYDLASHTFTGSAEQEKTLRTAFMEMPGWRSEYERVQKEAEAFLRHEQPIGVEVLRMDRRLGTFALSELPVTLFSIAPGRYVVRFSNGRVLWEGDLAKEDVIWAFAYPALDLPLAAETDREHQTPTRTISLLDGELLISVFAGLEAGELTIDEGDRIPEK